MSTRNNNRGAHSRSRFLCAEASPVFICLLLASLTVAVFWPVLGCDFISYDDPVYFSMNPHVLAGVSWDGIVWSMNATTLSNWHPVTWWSFMLDAELFGAGPLGPHLTNLLFHTGNTILLFLLLRRLTGAKWRSALVAALFAVHPLHVESVAWVAERKDVLSIFFALLALWGYAGYASGIKISRSRSWTCYGAALLCFALGLMSKSMIVTLPFVMLLLDWWPLKRGGEWPREARDKLMRSDPAPQSTSWPNLVLEKAPFFALSGASCVITWGAHEHTGALSGLPGGALPSRIANALVSYLRYLGMTFWPADLALPYPLPPGWPILLVSVAAVTVAGLSAAAWWFGRRCPYLLVGWFWFLGTLVPVIRVVRWGNQAMADRFTYFPLVGLSLLLVWGAGAVLARPQVPKTVIGLAAGLLVASCSLRTRAQLRYWRNSGTLFTHSLAVTGDNSVAANQLGLYLTQQARYGDAIRWLREAVRIDPGYGMAYNNLGVAIADTGKPGEAMACYRDALRVEPDCADAMSNWGNALAALGRMDEAMVQFQQALEIKPDNATVQYDFGSVLLQKGLTAEAVAHYQKALDLDPDFAEAHHNIGWILLLNGRIEEAIAHLQKAVQIKPSYGDAHFTLANALLQEGDVGEAIAHYKAALQIQPQNPQVENNLAWVLATCPDASFRDGRLAVELAGNAVRLSGGKSPLILRTQAAAFAETGRFTDALATARQALELATAQSNQALADALQRQMKFFATDSPFRDTSQNVLPSRSQQQ